MFENNSKSIILQHALLVMRAISLFSIHGYWNQQKWCGVCVIEVGVGSGVVMGIVVWEGCGVLMCD